MPAHTANSSNLSGGGPLATSSIKRIRTKLGNWWDRYREAYRDLRCTWVLYKMRLPDYGTNSQLKNRNRMRISQQNGLTKNLRGTSKQSTYMSMHSTVAMLICQCRMANAGYRRQIIRDFQTQLYKTCGMRSTILVAYEDEKGNIRACMYAI